MRKLRINKKEGTILWVVAMRYKYFPFSISRYLFSNTDYTLSFHDSRLYDSRCEALKELLEYYKNNRLRECDNIDTVEIMPVQIVS